jgi:hypothetical protein
MEMTFDLDCRIIDYDYDYACICLCPTIGIVDLDWT